ncbi:MAG: 16S rRNA (cytosine(1402)-N(4))-methyltransferase [Deltaproteobacteria bacterium RIFOXYD12_FULL_57_12]|nr:MAG: 16S rRNA (cytosine(1402)-N(4))-methyltransferase [Deltaproteobacteria bacterium RIFOXYD12_FULL_57_12]
MPQETTPSHGEIHCPVLLEEILAHLLPRDNGIYVDGTMGLGGHTAAILDRCSPNGRVIAFEWDARAIVLAQKKLATYGDRVQIVRRNFAEIKQGLTDLGIPAIDGLILDLGLSSLHLDEKTVSGTGRGFSFRGGEPLDMRMDNRMPRTAADLVNNAAAEELADIFFYYGEERQARRIAAGIVTAREQEKIETTEQLAAIASGAVPKRFHPKKIHAATKVFQALRIATNHELENLEAILRDAPPLLNPGARFCAISFHSLEDRMIKWGFRNNPTMQELSKKPVIPTMQECQKNPRARSAKLRSAIKL